MCFYIQQICNSVCKSPKTPNKFSVRNVASISPCSTIPCTAHTLPLCSMPPFHQINEILPKFHDPLKSSGHGRYMYINQLAQLFPRTQTISQFHFNM